MCISEPKQKGQSNISLSKEKSSNTKGLKQQLQLLQEASNLPLDFKYIESNLSMLA